MGSEISLLSHQRFRRELENERSRSKTVYLNGLRDARSRIFHKDNLECSLRIPTTSAKQGARLSRCLTIGLRWIFDPLASLAGVERSALTLDNKLKEARYAFTKHRGSAEDTC
jgi:hypothetical protein